MPDEPSLPAQFYSSIQCEQTRQMLLTTLVQFVLGAMWKGHTPGRVTYFMHAPHSADARPARFLLAERG